MTIVADTSAMYVAFDDSEPEHDEAKEIMERDTLVISDFVLTEIDHLVQYDHGFDAPRSSHSINVTSARCRR